ncbi:putative TRAP-type C4-dicarboxylate transport system, large permease component [Pusillimonas sp. T7-7]|uniref:TRAP transporter large permease n=1 Tax=Pusillimonas sp. (strain T7-7) TaxID=1007105 RepID=UPI00020850A8|nr:TRAP transporter large permease subunit [Pusillimonas sp. T7-7]AEC21273.1 putative TRAP-type C4-dicarboxylate transport system, large permease component [Pusillimonas sp. T7-7]
MTVIISSLLAILLLLLGSSVWIGIGLAATGSAMLMLFRDIPIGKLLAQYTWNILTTQELLALPMFIVMGEVLFRTRLSQSLFNGLAPWASLLPGRLLHVNVIGSTIFAAISGSSAATTQVVGRISLAELDKRGYGKSISLGSLAGAGTLGFLIPPSNIMIIYGVLGDVSVLKLFMAGVVPGLLLAGCFMGWVMIHSHINPELVPKDDPTARIAWRTRFKALKDLGPVMLLIVAILGSMYAGIATPSESAAVGVLGALLIAYFQKGLTRQSMRDIAMGSIQTCAMIALILLGASILSHATAFLGITKAISGWVTALSLSPIELIAVLIALYIVLGAFLDGFSMMVLTLPIVLPIVTAAGFDPIWFGVFLVIVIEMAQITPPVGFNLFMLQGLSDLSIGRVAWYSAPYLLIMILFVFLLVAAPDLVLWLPRSIAGSAV